MTSIKASNIYDVMQLEVKDPSLIASIEDNSDDFMKRVFITFTNGNTLSIIRGRFSYGGKSGLFEIMPNDPLLFDKKDRHNDVLGFLSYEDVNYYINKIATTDLSKLIEGN